MINQENNDLYDLNEALKVENLTLNDYEEICKRLKRKPNRTELGMFGVMWSEHCCYRNSKPLLSKFPTKGKNVLVGPGENAGVIDVGNNQKLVFKIESHNHPSAIEPFQGAATGVGGILRDIFTMGARPIAVLNSLRFGNLDKSSNVDSNRLEDWLEEDEDISQNLDFKQKSFYNDNKTSQTFSEKKDDPWI